MPLMLSDSTLETVARRHLRMGRVRELQALLEEWAQAQPASPSVRVLQGWMLLLGGRAQEGRELVESCMAAIPNSALAYLAMGAMHGAAGKVHEAIVCWQRSLALDAGDMDAAALLSQAHISLGDVKSAQEVARNVLIARPKEAIAHLTLAEALLAGGENLEEAVQLCARAVTMDPDDWRGWMIYGRVLAMTNRPTDARAKFERALLLRPGEPEVMQELTLAYLRLMCWTDAEQMSKKLLALNPKYIDGYRLLSSAYEGNKQPQQAQETLMQALRVEPNSATLLLDLAGLHRREGHIEEARVVVQQVQIIAPDLHEPVYFLAELALLEGDVVTAFDILARHEKTRPTQHEGLPQDPAAVAGRTVILTCDTLVQSILLARYARDLAKEGPQSIHIACAQPTQWGALGISFQDVQGVIGIDQPVPADALVEPLCSLVGRSGVKEASDLWRGPYLTVQAEHVQQIAQFMAQLPHPWVGVEVSTQLDKELLPGLTKILRECGGTVLVLGPGLSDQELGCTAVRPPLDDLYALAAWVQALDVVMSMGGLVPSIAGALGKQAHLLLPTRGDALWGLEASTTPWYPSLVLHRQSQQTQWQDAVSALHAILPTKTSSVPTPDAAAQVAS